MLSEDKINLQTIAENWFTSLHWQVFPFQKDCWQAYLSGKSGLLNAPTGSGKTYAIWIGCLLEAIQYQNQTGKKAESLQVIWITPLRALTQDIARAMRKANEGMQVDWDIAIRTGDTPASERKKQQKRMPQCLLTTPESIHLLLAQKGYSDVFRNLKAIVIDEWHELLGTKRGVMVELAIARLKAISQSVKVWGISATIGNIEEAAQVVTQSKNPYIIKAKISKQIEFKTVIPPKIERFSWAGHLGVNMIAQVIPIIEQSRTTLIFTNTRAQAEIWYQTLLEKYSEYLGLVAIHHGSLERETRDWVENALHEGILKVVICTSSLDLGVDFRPVETVIQVGSPKAIARFLQRAGRSGHAPGAISRIWFVPSQTLELIEASALRSAIKSYTEGNTEEYAETKPPLTLCFDVLAQYITTLAIADGFSASELLREIRQTYCFKNITDTEFYELVHLLALGGKSLSAYNEYHKLTSNDGDFFVVKNKKIAMIHRLNIGSIVSEPMLNVKFLSGRYIGTVEEHFASRLQEGDVFCFGGHNLEFIRIKDLTILVKLSKKRTGLVPRWQGSRLPLSSKLAQLIRHKFHDITSLNNDIEIQSVIPLLALQKQVSALPTPNELLIEYFESKDGFHLLFYPFAGKLIHEALACLFAYRISQKMPITFTIATNDYGFELLSDKRINVEAILKKNELFSKLNLWEDLKKAVNTSELAKRRFREIAVIAGLIFQNYPNKHISYKHLEVSSQLLFDVFSQYEPDNLLFKQAFREMLLYLVEQERLTNFLDEFQKKIIIKYPTQPTPLAFPIMAEYLRDQVSSEKAEARIARIQLVLERS